MAKRAWETVEGESSLAFAAFEIYRRLGPGRTVEEAWRRYWSRPGTRRRRTGQGPPPRVMPYFSRWGVTWHWRERALGWDNEQAELERDQQLDRELQEKAREHEEELRQRRLWMEEARAARTLARRVLKRALKGIDAKEIDGMTVREILPHIHRISALLETGQRLERMALGEATDVIRQETGFPADTEEMLLKIMQRFVPAERWQELAEELKALGTEAAKDEDQ